VTKRSVNLIRELRGYTWQKDRDGNSLNEPIGVNDHAMDAFRYGAFTWLTEYAQSGQYAFGYDSNYYYKDEDDW
jgi:phage terminase large subunit